MKSLDGFFFFHQNGSAEGIIQGTEHINGSRDPACKVQTLRSRAHRSFPIPNVRFDIFRGVELHTLLPPFDTWKTYHPALALTALETSHIPRSQNYRKTP